MWRKIKWGLGICAGLFIVLMVIAVVTAPSSDNQTAPITSTQSSMPIVPSSTDPVPVSEVPTTSSEIPALLPGSRPASPTQPLTYYANCSAARAAGAAPIHRGDPGYRSALDRDNDGVACER